VALFEQIEKWSITRHPKWLALPRIALGIFLIAKGITFISNTVSLENILSESNMTFGNTWFPILITWLHLICGFMIIIGLFTRFFTLLMLPILLGAVIFVNAPKGIFAADTELGFSIAILLLLIFFFLEGGGPISLDSYLKKNPK
jgi:uncharacterized membrane protein YphA (DoxX/SURF4 family)